jgi:hypothetical protein
VGYGRIDRPRKGSGDKMYNRLRARLTYANVMSTLAVFLVLGGGTALAAYVVSSNSQIGPGTVSGHKPPSGDHANVIPGSLNGTDLADGAVGPADLANGAVTASKLGSVAKFRKTNSSPANFVQAFALGGVHVRYRCVDTGGGHVQPVLIATTTVDHASITLGFTTGISGVGSSFVDSNPDFSTGDLFVLTENKVFGEGTAVYSTPAGSVVTLNYGFDRDPCLVHGLAIQR